jgi:hypothetical protein
VLPRDVLTIFPPDDRVALFVVSLCMASNDVEDALTEIEAFPRENVEGDEPFLRRRFSYRVRLLGGHLYEGTVALKAWRRSEPGIRELLGKLDVLPQDVPNAGDRWAVADRAVASAVVVVVEPVWQCLCPMGR